MINFYDIAYWIGVAVSAPFWLARTRSRKKVLGALQHRMAHEIEPRSSTGPAVMIHAVSLGEINATSALVKLLQQARPDLHVIVSTTTDTGYDRGKQLYGNATGVTLIRFPLDFTPAVDRLLNRVRPSLLVLMELEVWPNLLRQCDARRILVVLVNGRMTAPAFKKYRLTKPVTSAMFRRIAAVCAQDETYAHRFRQLGAPADRVSVTGTMKFDTAQVSDRVDGDDPLARELGLSVIAASGSRGRSPSSENEPPLPAASSTEPLWVCGSTGPGEEQIILDAYDALRHQHPNLRLAIIPRHPQRFDEVAAIIKQRGLPLLRRSERTPVPAGTQPVILGDTMGELRKFYSLADVVLVGRSLVDLGPRQHGSDMIEPAALAKPIVVGPWTHNFAEPMQKFRDAHAIREITKHIPSELRQTIDEWLKAPTAAAELGKRAQQVVRENQGATSRHAAIILEHLPSQSGRG